MAELIVNADDFGLHAAVNTAIEKCVEFGSVNSVSIIANGAAPDYELLKRFSDKKIFTGAHLTWVGEPWITGPVLIADWRQLAKGLFLGGKAFKEKMRVEAEAQINRLLENGIALDHIDSHQHVHHFPGVWEMTLALKEKYNIPRIRTAYTKNASLARHGMAGFILNYLAHKGDGFSCAGIKHAGNYKVELFAAELKTCAGYNTELIVHPGGDNGALNQRYSSWNFNWEQEYTALLTPQFLKAMADNGFSLKRK
jgi:predicted glycoside hydrolase/deacetylase ChbG (UPF0249 family)